MNKNKKCFAQFERSGSSASIWIYEQIGDNGWGDGMSAKHFGQELRDLGDVSEISVFINSPGGSVWDGTAIFNTLRNHPARVTTYIDGLAASMASVIAMAGDEVVMRDNALFMIHNPWSIVIGDADEMRKAAGMLDKVKETIVTAYQGRSSLNDEELSELMNDETWMTADEALEWGFIDSVSEGLELAASIDISRFTNAPAAQCGVPVIPKSAIPDDKQEEGIMPQEKESAKKVDNSEFKAAEKARRSEIRNIFAPFADQRDLQDECLDNLECTADQARAKLLEACAAGVKPIGAEPSIVAGEDAGTKFVQGAAQALSARIGVEKREAGNEFNGMSLVDIARASLQRHGQSVSGKSADHVARMVLAAHSTSDFPELLANTANRRLRAAYEAYEHNWRGFSYVSSVPDFKANKRIQLGSFNSLETIPEGGEYKYGTVAEEAESITAVTKGRALALTRQMLVNDDLGGFDRRAQFMGRAAARTVASDVFAVINDNAAMSDSVALFHASHNNLESAAALTVASLSSAKKAMRIQQNGDDYLNIMPRNLLVPVAIEGVAQELIASQVNPAKSNNTPNIHRGTLNVIADPYLDATSATAWYLTADPNDVAMIEVAFLDGEEVPFVDDMVDWETDCMKFKVRLDYGTAAIDYRAGVKNPGA